MVATTPPSCFVRLFCTAILGGDVASILNVEAAAQPQCCHGASRHKEHTVMPRDSQKIAWASLGGSAVLKLMHISV